MNTFKSKLLVAFLVALVLSSCSTFDDQPSGTLVFTSFVNAGATYWDDGTIKEYKSKTEIFSKEILVGDSKKLLTIDGTAFISLSPKDSAVAYTTSPSILNWEVGLVSGSGEILYTQNDVISPSIPVWKQDEIFYTAEMLTRKSGGENVIVGVGDKGNQEVVIQIPAGFRISSGILPVDDSRLVILATNLARKPYGETLLLLSGNNFTQLTFDNTRKGVLRLVPGGQKVSYVESGFAIDGQPDCVVTVDLKSLVKNSVFCTKPNENIKDFAWSPDGQFILIKSFEILDDYQVQNTQLSLVDAKGNELRRITHDENVNTMAWSPDGQWFAFSLDKGQEIFLVQLKKGGKEITIPVKGEVFQIFWQN